MQAMCWSRSSGQTHRWSIFICLLAGTEIAGFRRVCLGPGLSSDAGDFEMLGETKATFDAIRRPLKLFMDKVVQCPGVFLEPAFRIIAPGDRRLLVKEIWPCSSGSLGLKM